MLRELKSVDVKGKKFQVSISDEGKFFAEYDHEQISAESLKQLTDKLASRIKRSKRVGIPICMWEKQSWNDKPGKIRSGTIIGIHGRNDNILVKFDDEAKSTQVSYGDFFDPADAAELKRVAEALNSAEQAFYAFRKQHAIDVKGKVREALDEIGDAEDAP